MSSFEPVYLNLIWHNYFYSKHTILPFGNSSSSLRYNLDSLFYFIPTTSSSTLGAFSVILFLCLSCCLLKMLVKILTLIFKIPHYLISPGCCLWHGPSTPLRWILMSKWTCHTIYCIRFLFSVLFSMFRNLPCSFWTLSGTYFCFKAHFKSFILGMSSENTFIFLLAWLPVKS